MDVFWEIRRRPAVLGSVSAGLVVAVLLLATSPGLPMVWDEGNAIVRARAIAGWDWQYTTTREGHPALYGIVIALGRWVSGGWLGPLDSARFGPMLLFGAAAAAMFYRMWRDYSAVAALAAVASWVLLPRMFAHAHFASFDGPLTSCWVLCWAGYAAARQKSAAAVVWGVFLGMTLSCKATGWFAVLPFIAVALLYRDRPGGKALGVGLPAALAVFLMLNPPLWHEPIRGLLTFFDLNWDRAARPGLNISTWFLGRMYNLDYPLPWYNTLVWTAVTVPVGTLLLAAAGVAAALRRRRVQQAGVLLLANWLVLVVVRALPFAPPHDGVRLFLPSFAFLAALAGLGCHAMLAWVAGRWHRGSRARWLALTGMALLFAGNATSLVWYAPQWLSYYNLLAGGLRGATAMGMEPSYYWDALDRSVLGWLHARTAPDEKICFAAGPPEHENLDLMRRWGTLRRATGREAPGAYRWYVIQHRPSAWQPVDRWLIRRVRPAYVKTIRRGGLGPWCLDVPLLTVYRYADYVAARQRVAQ